MAHQHNYAMQLPQMPHNDLLYVLTCEMCLKFQLMQFCAVDCSLMKVAKYTMEDLLTCMRDLFYMSQTMSD